MTAVKTGKLLEVDVHPNFGTLMSHKAFFLVYMVQDVYAYKREECSILECFKGISCTTSTRRNISCDVCEKITYSRTKTTMVCDWNRLPLSVAVAAEPT